MLGKPVKVSYSSPETDAKGRIDPVHGPGEVEFATPGATAYYNPAGVHARFFGRPGRSVIISALGGDAPGAMAPVFLMRGQGPGKVEVVASDQPDGIQDQLARAPNIMGGSASGGNLSAPNPSLRRRPGSVRHVGDFLDWGYLSAIKGTPMQPEALPAARYWSQFWSDEITGLGRQITRAIAPIHQGAGAFSPLSYMEPWGEYAGHPGSMRGSLYGVNSTATDVFIPSRRRMKLGYGAMVPPRAPRWIVPTGPTLV